MSSPFLYAQLRCMEENTMTVKVENITKTVGGNTLFKDLDITIPTGKHVALVGRNGTGKTSLLRLIAAVDSIDSGRIITPKDSKIGYLHQIPQYRTETVEEVLLRAFHDLQNMQQTMQQLEAQMAREMDDRVLEKYGELQERFMQLGGYEMQSKMMTVANGLGIALFLDKPFEALSGGEKTKVMLAHILLGEPTILLLDEPTNHLDLRAIEWLEHYVKQFDGTVIVVSHDRRFMNEVAEQIIELEDGEAFVSQGNYDAYVAAKEAHIASQFSQYNEQQKKIKKMKESIRRLRQWANEASPPNPDLFRKAKMMEKALARIEVVKKPVVAKKMNLALQAESRSGKEVATFEDVTACAGDRVLFFEANFSIYWQDKLAIVGDNGTGKSTILKLLLAEREACDGSVKLGSNVQNGYLAQQFDTFQPEDRLIDAFRDEVAVTEGEARHILAQFLFYGYDVFKKVKDLSGGEKMRLRLAQLMQQKVNLLLLDEPTNHLDIESREVLEETLENFDGTVIAVSHDRYFLEKLFTRTAWIEHECVTMHDGPYDFAKDKQRAQAIEREITFLERKLTHTEDAHLTQQLEKLYEAL